MAADPKQTGDFKLQNNLESQLAASMGKFFAVMENYPQLKSDQTFLQAQVSYNEVETQIAAARRFYNSALGGLNNICQIFPGNILAKFAITSPLPGFYTIDKNEAETVNVDDYLKGSK